MKTKILILTLALGYVFVAFSQKATLELTFTAKYNGQYVPLDSILIENLTQGGDTILYAPDTVLVLEYITSIGDHAVIGQNSISFSQNYPNPFTGQTTIHINVPEKENVDIMISDLSGREVVHYCNTLKKGNHSFIFYSGDAKHYLCTVTGAHTSKTIKMINVNRNTSFEEKCKLVYNGNVHNLNGYKSQRLRRVACATAKAIGGTRSALAEKSINNFGFELGDQLRFTGYALTINDINGSDIIKDIPLTNEIYEFEIEGGIPCPGLTTITYEGQEYNTQLIGNQCWLKENLNIGTMVNGTTTQTDNDTIEKYCYDNNPVNCETYGGLYQWDEMMQYASAQGAQGICPPDWHLPTDEEWKQLEGEVDSLFGYPDPEWNTNGFRGYDAGLNLKATNSWLNNGNGNDLYGFTALPGGYRHSNGNFDHLGYIAFFWTSSVGSSSYRRMRRLSYDSDKIYRYSYTKSYGFSVRCVKEF